MATPVPLRTLQVLRVDHRFEASGSGEAANSCDTLDDVFWPKRLDQGRFRYSIISENYQHAIPVEPTDMVLVRGISVATILWSC